MSNKEDEILARELGKLGAIGGAVGGGVGGALGGGLGAGLAAGLLPNDTFELDIEIAAKPSDVLKTTYDILSHTGRMTEGTEPPSDLPTLCAVVGSGFWNLNPALVRVVIVPFSESTTKVSVRGTAKEGLIKQRAGEKAAKRIADLLSQAFSFVGNHQRIDPGSVADIMNSAQVLDGKRRENTMICSHCGSDIRPGAAFCRQCGARVDNAQAGIPKEGAQISYQQAPSVYHHSPVQSSGAAITSLVVGIVTHVVALVIACPTIAATYGIGAIVCMPLLLVGWVTSLITGYIGRQKIRASQGRLTGDSAAVAGIILGWIGVGLVVFLVVIGVILYILLVIFGVFLLPFMAEYGS